MKQHFLRLCLVVAVAWLVPRAWSAPPNYEQHMKPLFRSHCLKCHNSDDSEADLDLSSYTAVLEGGASGAVVHAGRPQSSQLFRSITHTEGVEAMPPESPQLAEAKVALVRDWIQGGLLQGEGSVSKLRGVAVLDSTSLQAAEAPMPTKITPVAISATVRAPIPQALATSPGAPLFAVSGQEQVLLYGRPRDAAPTADFSLLGALPFPEGTLHVLRFSRNGQLLLAAGGRGAHSGRVVIFDVQSGQRVAEIGDEVDSVLAADISADHRYIALGGPSKLVKVFDATSGKLLHRIDKHTDWITAIEFSPDGQLVATADRSGGIHVWDAAKGAIAFTLSEHKVRVTGVRWRRDGKLLASVAEDGHLILWDMKDGWATRNVTAHASKTASRYSRATGVQSVDFNRDGSMVTVGRDGKLRRWSPTGEKAGEWDVPGGLPTAAAFVASGKQVVTGSFDGTLCIWTEGQESPQQVLSTASSDK